VPESKSFHIPTYVHFIAPLNNMWLTQAEANASASRTRAKLNANFNQVGIYFLPGTTDLCNTALSNIIMTNLTDIGMIRAQIPSAVHDDGLDIYVQMITIPAEGYGGDAIPGNYCSFKGNYNGIWSNETDILLHEVGHDLGLLHTFAENCNGLVPFDPANPGYCTGDFIADVPLTANQLQCSSTYADNFMCYTNLPNCRSRFSPDQVLRMRTHLAQHPALAGISLKPKVYQGTPITISNPSGNIIVESGTLEITQTLEMLPGASIRVKPGARLYIKSTITGACGKLWQGVIVEGDGFASQIPANQGWVYMFSSGKIEHAQVGINVQNVDANGIPATMSGGGIVNISVGKLENNIIGLKYGAYIHQQNNANQANVSKILFPRFKITNDYRAQETQPVFMDLVGIVKLGITRGDFIDARTVCDDTRPRPIGIRSISAGFNASVCFFENLALGIDAKQLTLGSGSFAANSCKFRNCFKGLNAMSSSGFSIDGSTFALGKPIPCASTGGEIIGAKIEGPTATMAFSGNSFINSLDSETTETLVGTDVSGLGAGMQNTIHKNSYSNVLFGNRAKGVNAGATQEGLRYTCNLHSRSIDLVTVAWAKEKADFIEPGATIHSRQANLDDAGNFINPAGNVFSGILENFFNQGGTVTYVFDADAPDQDPVGSGTFTNLILKAESTSDDYCNLIVPPPCNPCERVELNGLEGAFFTAQAAYQNNLAISAQYYGNQPPVQLEEEIHAKRALMSYYASIIINSFLQDTLGVEIDSVFYWLAAADTYEANLLLSKHYFFSQEFTRFDQIWSNTMVKYGANGYYASEIAHLSAFFNQLREKNVNDLPSSDQDELKEYLSYCDASAHFSKLILSINGIASEVQCNSTAERLLREIGTTQQVNSLIIHPNPANSNFMIDLPLQGVPYHLSLVNLLGETVSDARSITNEVQLTIPVVQIPEGVYLVRLEQGLQTYLGKVVILH
jgi:Pregnancy-associated plasma protein-A/Secretion system C-terminal sorting domain